MPGNCKDCIYCRPQEKRWWGNHYGAGCAAEEDGIHKLGWGRLQYDADGEVKRRGHILLVEGCYYYEAAKEEFEQMSLFEET